MRHLLHARARAVLALAAVFAVSLIILVPRVSAASSRAAVVLYDANGMQVGVVKLVEGEDGVMRVRASVKGFTAGFHGFHVHTTGICTPPDFTSAGSHLNPKGGDHPGHAGDQPVILANGDGSGWLAFATDRYTMADILDADGSAYIVHANPDNYANIPTDRYDPDPDATTLATGDAGSRIACGVVEEA